MVDCKLLKDLLLESEATKEKLEAIKQSLEGLLESIKSPKGDKELAGLLEELVDNIDFVMDNVKSLISITLAKAYENKCIEWK